MKKKADHSDPKISKRQVLAGSPNPDQTLLDQVLTNFAIQLEFFRGISLH